MFTISRLPLGLMVFVGLLGCSGAPVDESDGEDEGALRETCSQKVTLPLRTLADFSLLRGTMGGADALELSESLKGEPLGIPIVGTDGQTATLGIQCAVGATSCTVATIVESRYKHVSDEFVFHAAAARAIIAKISALSGTVQGRGRRLGPITCEDATGGKEAQCLVSDIGVLEQIPLADVARRGAMTEAQARDAVQKGRDADAFTKPPVEERAGDCPQ